MAGIVFSIPPHTALVCCPSRISNTVCPMPTRRPLHVPGARVVRRLVDILPVKLMTPAGHGSSGSTGAGAPRGGAGPVPEEERALVMICGLLLPDSRDDIGELVQLLPVRGGGLDEGHAGVCGGAFI